MQHYGISDVRNCTKHADRHVEQLPRKQPEMPASPRAKCERRTLRRRPERPRRQRWPGTLFVSRSKRYRPALLEVNGRTKGTLLFGCPICRNILDRPVTFECGHTLCGDCLDRGGGCDCAAFVPDPGASRGVNVLVQELAEKWLGWRGYVAASVAFLPKAMSAVGIEPRYHLRTGFAGLQPNEKDGQVTVVSTNLRKRSYNLIKTLEQSRLSRTPRTAFRLDSNSTSIRCAKQAITINDLDCILCSRCLLDPVTTSCGHTFCRDCLLRVLDHGLSCPLCMGALSVKDYSRGTTAVLDQAIRVLFPNKHKERLFMNWMDIYSMTNGSTLPVFICTNAFPGVACPLYVNEPRYRLLVRRCLMSATPRFAMVAKDVSGKKFYCYGTVLEVKDAVHLEDGSFILTTVGIRRFKVHSYTEQDGYDVAKVQFIKDSTVNADKIPELIALHEKVYSKTFKWIRSLTPKALEEVERVMGIMPPVENNWLTLPDGPLWTWWLMPILPLISRLQVCFLGTTSLEKRLRVIDKLLERIDVKMMALERNMNCSCSGMPYEN